MRWIIAVLIVLSCSVDSRAANMRIIDGDTIVLDGTHYRLWGIDAPEMHQYCGTWPAGYMARQYLEKLILYRDVHCTSRGRDMYGRTVAICMANGQDIGREMVRAGMAWAFIKYSRDYEWDEQGAKMSSRGIFAHGCKPAWEFRHGH